MKENVKAQEYKLFNQNKAFQYKKAEVSESTKYYLLLIFSLLAIAISFAFQSPVEILEGMIIILTIPGRLLTDYIEIASIGAALFNAGLLTFLSIIFVRFQKVSFSGPLVAAILMIFGFSLFGKNLFNTIPITIGVYLYSKVEKRPLSHFILISLFGTALGPVVSQIAFDTGFNIVKGILLGYIVGILIGFILPPLSIHFFSFHQGFSLYNIGFASGMVGMFIMAILSTFDIYFEPANFLSEGNNLELSILIYSLCLIIFILGFYYNGFSLKGYRNLLNHSGKLITDFFLIEGFGRTLINMSFQGVVATSFVLLVGGQLNGPVIGGIFATIGFGAFGKHPLNCIPILMGAYLAAYFTPFSVNSTNILIASLFGTALAPISGYYGITYGFIAGILQTVLVLQIGAVHGGLNLYNGGFAAGFIAATLVPIYDFYLNKKNR